MVDVMMIGRPEALARYTALREGAEESFRFTCCELDPASLPTGLLGRFFAKRRLSRALDKFDEESLILVVECEGDSAWLPWMIYALGNPLRKIAVPRRLRGIENIEGLRSGVSTYEELETADDLETIDRAALWEVQKCARAR